MKKPEKRIFVKMDLTETDIKNIASIQSHSRATSKVHAVGLALEIVAGMYEHKERCIVINGDGSVQRLLVDVPKSVDEI